SPKVTNTKQFGPNGRDHWPNCYTVLFAGGGTIPGAVFGSSDRIGAYPSTDPVTPDDVAATMFWALGIDPATEVTDTLGCRSPIGAGKPIESIFGCLALTHMDGSPMIRGRARAGARTNVTKECHPWAVGIARSGSFGPGILVAPTPFFGGPSRRPRLR